MALLNELKRLAARDPWPVAEIYDELASNASTSLDIAAYFSSWDQARNTMYYSRAKRYPRLPSRRQDLRLTAEQTTTKSGAQFLMYHSPTNDILIFATEAGVRLLAQSNCWCGDGTFKIVPSWYQQLFTLHVFMRVKLLPVVYCLTVKKDLPTYSWIFEVLHPKAEASNLIRRNLFTSSVNWKPCFSTSSGSGFQPLKFRFGMFMGKTETVVRQMDNGYTRGRGSVRRSAAYGVQQRWVAAVTGRLHRNEIGIEHFLKAIAYTPAPVPL
ncbi:hypothetical protein T11_9568 [Trichinella zimbabwensis]|uniref:MULE transposase domain-containing protein n=1 Tax=Trichinella zimbabwensis TaxID=268475 RepID=A0A0V1HXR1_9BILA|nr:hypothetical protein T11_9568 [Trichinella zimbabwensis]